MKINPFIYTAEGKEFIIREACIDDAEQLLIHLKKTYMESVFHRREVDEFDYTVEGEKRYIEYKISNPLGLLLVVETDGQIVGYLTVEGSELKRLKHRGEFGIAVQKQFWGLGIGKKLVGCMLEWGKNNIEKITLRVDTQNVRAIGFYKKFGFEIEGTFKKDKKFSDGTYHDTHAMALFL